MRGSLLDSSLRPYPMEQAVWCCGEQSTTLEEATWWEYAGIWQPRPTSTTSSCHMLSRCFSNLVPFSNTTTPDLMLADFLTRNNVQTLPWPSNSPDMNATEHILGRPGQTPLGPSCHPCHTWWAVYCLGGRVEGDTTSHYSSPNRLNAKKMPSGAPVSRKAYQVLSCCPLTDGFIYQKWVFNCISNQ